MIVPGPLRTMVSKPIIVADGLQRLRRSKVSECEAGREILLFGPSAYPHAHVIARRSRSFSELACSIRLND
jgi:hypothetical protein